MSNFSITKAQPRAWSLLQRSQATNRLGSAYLICGAEGYGHWPFALAFAALVNCEQIRAQRAEEPCGECRACRLIAAANFEGIHVLAPIKSYKKFDEAIELTAGFVEARRKEPFALLDTSSPVTIPIDMARELKKTLSQKAIAGVHRVAIIYRIDRMRSDGTDSLLKLVEEPPENTTLLLTTVNLEGVSPTIQSRCRAISLEPIAESYLTEYLTTHYKLSSDKAKLLSRISDRDLGRAISPAGIDDDESSDRAVGLLMFKSLFVESSPATIAQITEFMAEADRGQAEELVRLWGSLIRDCTAYAATGSDDDLINVDFAADIRRLSSHFADPDVGIAMTKSLKNTLADFRLNVHIHPTLAALALRLRSTLAAGA